MGTPLGPKYIPYTYMDPMGVFWVGWGGFGGALFDNHLCCLKILAMSPWLCVSLARLLALKSWVERYCLTAWADSALLLPKISKTLSGSFVHVECAALCSGPTRVFFCVVRLFWDGCDPCQVVCFGPLKC